MKKEIIGFLLFVILTSSIYIMIPDSVRISIQETKSVFKIWENDSWVLSGTEWTNLFDGTAKMRAKSRSLTQSVDDEIITIKRFALYKDNITVNESYIFNGHTTDIKLFPVEHEIIVTNGQGKILQYEVTDLLYTSETVKGIPSPQNFGHQMKVEWDYGNYYSRIYKYKYQDKGKLTIKYRIENETSVYNVRLFDPPTSAFNSTWDTTKAGVSNSTSITLPLESGGVYNFVVEWGDGNSSNITAWDSSNKTHDYGAGNGGEYNLSVIGIFQGFRFNDGGDKLKILDISNWGILNLGNSDSYFYGAANLMVSAIDALNLTGTTTLAQAFLGATIFSGDLSLWDVSSITNMQSTFELSNFSGDISTWDVSSVTNMIFAFSNTNYFNSDIGNWDVSNVISMNYMFYSSSLFNQDLTLWCVSNIGSEPGSFATLSALTSENKPIWGTCPGINITSPENATYNLYYEPTLDLNWSYDMTPISAYYSLNGAENVSLYDSYYDNITLYPNVLSGLPAMGGEFYETFEENGETFLIKAISTDSLTGYKWNGTGWESNSSAINGLSASGMYHPDVEIMDINGETTLIMSPTWTSTAYKGYTRTTGLWTADNSKVSGILTTTEFNTLASKNISGELYLMIGNSDASGMTGYKWNGTGWDINTSITTFNPSVNFYAGSQYTINLFSIGTKDYLLYGQYSADNAGNAVFVYEWNNSWGYNETIVNDLCHLLDCTHNSQIYVSRPSVIDINSISYILGYSIYGIFNFSIDSFIVTKNTTISSYDKGQNNITIYTENALNNMLSETIYFTGELGFDVTLNSPENETATANSTPDFNFTVSGSENSYGCEVFIDNIGYGIGTSECYQETANISTSCGGVDTGLYDISAFAVNPENMYDGDWDTYGYSTVGFDYDYYVNYTIPNTALSAIWRVKTGSYNLNFTIPPDCYDFYSETISLYYYGAPYPESPTVGGAFCYNGTWKEIGPTNTWNNDSLYEESITWDINVSQNNAEIIITANDTISDGTYDWFVNCTADSVVNQSEIRIITKGTIDFNWSIWLGSEWANASDYYTDFRCLPTQTDCEPTDQNTSESQCIYQVCNNGTAPTTSVKMNLTSICPNMDFKTDTDYTSADSIILSTTLQELYTVVSIDECIEICMWADYNNPDTCSTYPEPYVELS